MDSGLPGASGAANGLLKLVSPTSTSSTSNQIQGGFGGFLSKVIGIGSSLFGGGHAIGGELSVGSVYQINENGQELFAPSMNGRIMPHGQSAGGSGGSVYYSVQVADGVTPEQMDMHVRAALQEYHPHGVKAAVQAMQDHNRRIPASQR